MNTRPTATTILCYGDSNTWGQMPDRNGHRYAANVRWPGVLQQELGEDYYVIEEGLSSRTTNLDYAKKPGRNGHTYLEPCLDSHAPIDYVVLMLGTNDYKIEFNRSVEEIAAALGELIDLIQAKTAQLTDVAAKVIVVSPILVRDQGTRLAEWYGHHYDATSIAKSQALAECLQPVAQAKGCYFVDAAQMAQAGEDGIHLDEPSHRALGAALAQELKKLAA